MKLLKTYDRDGAQTGYFNYETRCAYTVGWPGYIPPAPRQWMVQVSEGEDLFQFLSPPYATKDEALTELDRIAALISGTVPAQGWVKGPPPKDGAWYLVTYTDTVDGSPQPGTAQWDDEQDAFYDDGGAPYGSLIITHHQPAPIVLP